MRGLLRRVRLVPQPDSCTAAKNKLATIGVFGWTRFGSRGNAKVTSISKRGNQNGGRLWPRGLRAENSCRIPLLIRLRFTRRALSDRRSAYCKNRERSREDTGGARAPTSRPEWASIGMI